MTKQRFWLIPASGLIGLVALLFLATLGQGHATGGPVFIVDDTANAADMVPGDGKCNTSGGVCTLRAAIMEANATAGPNTIELGANVTYTLTTVDNTNVCGDGNGLPVITSEITINGNGAIIERSAAGGIPFFRIFCVSSAGDLTLNDVTVSNGHSATTGLTIYPWIGTPSGGGIFNFGAATLNNVNVSGNTANFAIGNFVNPIGGGIVNQGTMTLTSSTVSGNRAGVPVGSAGLAGGIYNEGTMTLTNVTVSGNRAGGVHVNVGTGGGIVNLGVDATLTLTNSTVRGNIAGTGGGIFNTSGSTVTLTGSTVSGNTATAPGGAGGGLYNRFSGKMTLINSTVSGNEPPAPLYRGGGIYIDGSSTLILTSSTISGWGASVGINASVVHIDGVSAATLKNTIIVNGSPNDCTVGASAIIISDGHNLDSDGTCGLMPILGDLPGGNAKLDTLWPNAPGTTMTHALLPGSDAIDAGNPAGCTDDSGALLTTDQRGFPRPVGTFCDIGAYEFEPSAPPATPPKLPVVPPRVDENLVPGESIKIAKTVHVAEPADRIVPHLVGCSPLVVSFDPRVAGPVGSAGAGPAGEPPVEPPDDQVEFSETIAVPEGTQPGKIDCSVVFLADGVVIAVQKISITVKGDKLPVSPPSVDGNLAPGESIKIDKTVHVPEFAGIDEFVVRVFPLPVGCFPLVVSFDPAVAFPVPPDDQVRFSETIAVPEGTPEGKISCTVQFRAEVAGVGDIMIGVQEISITVKDDDKPPVSPPSVSVTLPTENSIKVNKTVHVPEPNVPPGEQPVVTLVTANPVGCFPLIVSFDPPSVGPLTQFPAQVEFSERILVPSLRDPPAKISCTVEFRADGVVIAVQEISITIDADVEVPTLRIGDVNGDDAVNSIDAALILQFIAGLLDSLPP